MPIELGSFSLGSVAGGIVGAVVAHYLTKSRDTEDRKIKEFNQAAATFRNRVLTELEGLYPIPTNWPTDKMMIDKILKVKFPKLQIAVTEFKPFLPKSQQSAFDKAWLIYRVGKDGREIDEQCYYDYMPFLSTSVGVGLKTVTIDTTETYKENFKHNVDNLLKYANIT